MFESIISSTGLTADSAIICTAASLGFGLLAALLYRLGSKKPSRSLLITLIILPTLVQAVIMLVNGSVGAGIAVMGAFNLVRFRSAPGCAKDICYIFYTMCIGLATGMGYIGFAVLLAIAVGVVLAVLGFIPWFRNSQHKMLLRIVIPENLEYNGVFDEIFKEYLSSAELVQVKTTAMGTLFDLRYEVTEKDPSRQKEMLDKIRALNGNLTISIGALQQPGEAL
ncbi:MAG: DUF4956 domain-containing protein [Oscillospiraceae bacterium]|nr:DUF4956 domain-containing protein [Oscillospiraceae bacterium]